MLSSTYLTKYVFKNKQHHHNERDTVHVAQLEEEYENNWQEESLFCVIGLGEFGRKILDKIPTSIASLLHIPSYKDATYAYKHAMTSVIENFIKGMPNGIITIIAVDTSDEEIHTVLLDMLMHSQLNKEYHILINLGTIMSHAISTREANLIALLDTLGMTVATFNTNALLQENVTVRYSDFVNRTLTLYASSVISLISALDKGLICIDHADIMTVLSKRGLFKIYSIAEHHSDTYEFLRDKVDTYIQCINKLSGIQSALVIVTCPKPTLIGIVSMVASVIAVYNENAEVFFSAIPSKKDISSCCITILSCE